MSTGKRKENNIEDADVCTQLPLLSLTSIRLL